MKLVPLRLVRELLTAAVFTLAPAAGFAESAANPAQKTYLRYCSACHGESGKGDGIVAHLMTPKPTDLTRLARDNKGEFPYLQLIKVIDGRQTVRAHGDPDMPVWGEIFQAEVGMTAARQAEVRGRLMLIADHILSIQAK